MKLVSNGEILDFFRRRIENLTGNSAKEYNKVFTSLSSFVPADTSTLSSPAKSIIEDWCVYLINGGLTKKTVTHYIDIVIGIIQFGSERGTGWPHRCVQDIEGIGEIRGCFQADCLDQ